MGLGYRYLTQTGYSLSGIARGWRELRDQVCVLVRLRSATARYTGWCQNTFTGVIDGKPGGAEGREQLLELGDEIADGRYVVALVVQVPAR